MGTYKVTGYYGTGFNTLNVPDSPTLLEKSATHTTEFDPLEILQDTDLQEIRVKAKWGAIQNIDYLKLYNDDSEVYYFVNGVTMLNTDTASLSVTMDFLTSVGGVDGLVVLDGVTTRVHVDDDSKFYTEEDVLTAPAERMNILTYYWAPLQNGDPNVFVESTVDLARMAVMDGCDVYTSTEKDSSGATVDYNVCVPQVSAVASSGYATTFIVGEGTRVGVSDAKTRVYNLNNTDSGDTAEINAYETTSKGIATCRALGIENCIVNQVVIPSSACEPRSVCYTIANSADTKRATNEVISAMEGKVHHAAIAVRSSIPDVKNKRCLYGSYTPVSFMTLTGDRAEYPLEMVSSGLATVNATCVCDPHLDGRPYFYVEQKSMEGTKDVMFFANSLKGMTWKKVPLAYTGASGSALTAKQYQLGRKYADTSYNQAINNIGLQADLASAQNYASAGGSVLSTVGNLASSIVGLFAGGGSGDAIASAGAMNPIGTTTNMMALRTNTALAETAINANKVASTTATNNAYAYNKALDAMNYQVSTQIVQPEVSFPYECEPAREMYDNGMLIAKYEYTTNDIHRIDRLLTMYGYKYTKPLQASDFNNREKFNYVECSNVTVKCTKTTGKRFREGVALMLRTGIRIWHEKPNVDAYDNNPIKA